MISGGFIIIKNSFTGFVSRSVDFYWDNKSVFDAIEDVNSLNNKADEYQSGNRKKEKERGKSAFS